VEQHEQFARGFEAYLMEGKAPSAELRTAFSRFKAWLTELYKDISLRVTLTDEVRGVFDRLLATEEEILAAQQEQQMMPLFADFLAAGLDEKTAARYAKALATVTRRKRFAKKSLPKSTQTQFTKP
jgi:hypothetical protein